MSITPTINSADLLQAAQVQADPIDLFLLSLTERGHLKSKDCERAVIFAREANLTVPRSLMQLGLIAERKLADLMANFLGLSVVEPQQLPDTACQINGLSVPYIKRAGIVPVEIEEDVVTIAVSDPFDDTVAQGFRMLTGRRVDLLVGVASELEAALQRLYGGGKTAVDEIVDGLEVDDNLSDAEAQRLKEMASQAPVVRLLNLLISRAVEVSASDIHVETYENRITVRFRLDGVLQDIETPPAQIGPALISRIKILSKLNIAERRLPQDGRIKLPVHGKMVDFRVSIVPTLHGERIVLRILDQNQSPKTLQALGFDLSILGSLETLLHRPNGMFLVTGPTGSGKTTTLYAALQILPTKQKNVITVEDPIEYQLDAVNQIQVKPGIGLSFASILRSILRQDPDIIMVGEIRDPETADIAVHAALTGHLMLSTLHTNSAAGAISRLIDMGVQDYLLTSALEGVLAQRLVRKLCPHCKVAITLPSERMRELAAFASATSPMDVFRAKGCGKCGNTGYSGRTVISELLLMTDPIRELVMRRAPSQEIEAAARAQSGMLVLKEDGLRLVAAGITSLEEVSSVVSGLD